MEKMTVSLDNIPIGEDVIFSPAEYTEDSDGNITIKCSLGNTYTANHSNSTFIKNFKTIYDSMKGKRYSLYCYHGRNNLECSVM